MRAATALHRVSLIALLSLAFSPPTRANDFLVIPGGSIQDAIDAALSNGDPFDQIAVAADIYNEAIVIDYTGSNQQFLTIGRATKFRPIITDGVTIEDARLVTLFGFEIGSSQGDGDAAVMINDTVGAAVIDCVIQPGDDGGIEAISTNEVIIDACTINGMSQHGDDEKGYGIKIVGRGCHSISDTKLNGNDYRGIWVEANRTEITNCKVVNTNDGSGHAGVYVDGALNLLKNNTISDNDCVGVIAIGTVEIKSNDIEENGDHGLRLGNNGGTQFFGGAVKNNTINNNAGFGIFIRSGQDGAEIRNNTIHGNRGAGIMIEGDAHLIDKNSIRQTKSSSDPGHGVHITSSADDNCVRKNTFKDNDGAAVRVEGDFNYVLLNQSKDGDSYINSGGSTGNEGRANQTSGQNDFP